MNETLQVNDIVLISEFGGLITINDPPAWAQVSEVDPPTARLNLGSVTFVTGPNEVTGSSGMWPLDTADVFKIVPGDEVPGEIWAKIAERALLGEYHND